MKTNTKQKGDTTEVKVLSQLIGRGYSVSIPFGDNDKYDLIVDTGRSLLRVQCKTGWIENEEKVRFKTCSKTTENGSDVTKDYDDEIDVFAVFCSETEECYWVPIEETGSKSTYLRITEAAIDHPSIRYAAEFRFERNLPPLQS